MTQHPFKPVLLDLLRQAQISQNAFFQELAPDELATIGTPDFWAAKDHVAHMTFWRQRLVLKLQAMIQHQAPPESEDFEQLNPIIFEEQRYRSWPDILSESDRVYDELITITDRLSEEDLTDFDRFNRDQNGAPLYSAFMGNCYEHTQQHLAQYSLDRHDPERAINTYEIWANRVIEAEPPEDLKGVILYNLACFYATHSRLEQAVPALHRAFMLYPTLKEFARTDPDLVALRLNQPE
jgi:tetratricopeptide (TPR) repeat protein